MALTKGTWGGIQYTVTGSAAQLTTVLGSVSGDPSENHFKQIDFKAAAGNSATVYLGKSNVTASPANACASIEKGTGYTIGPFNLTTVCSDDIYIIGTSNDILYIAVTR